MEYKKVISDFTISLKQMNKATSERFYVSKGNICSNIYEWSYLIKNIEHIAKDLLVSEDSFLN